MSDRLEDAEFVVDAILNTMEYRKERGEKMDLSYAILSALGNYLRNHRPDHPLWTPPPPEPR